MHFEVVRADGCVEEVPVVPDGGGRVVFERGRASGSVVGVSLRDSRFTAAVGEEGWFLLPDFWPGGTGVVTEFRAREDMEERLENGLPVYAAGGSRGGILAVVTGMSHEYRLVIGVRDGRYYLYPEFTFEKGCYEDIVVQYLELPPGESTPAGAARRYRRHQLETGACRPLRERVGTQPVLRDSLAGPEIRIRLAWKPMPPAVLEQSDERQPPLHVAMTFADCEKLLGELHLRGVDKAEFCLVGWNHRGHDGQYPDLLPVEPGLGGEPGLRRLTAAARRYGYRIGAHTNLLDSYSSARRFRREDMVVDREGRVAVGGRWCGGQSYLLCPRRAAERFLEEDMSTVRSLGFDGTHYFDVFTISRPIPCFHPDHPLTRRECAAWRGRMLQRARECLGASASEGCLDYAVGSLDYVLYAAFSRNGRLPAIFDRPFPFWPIVYHGILHYNAFAETVNAPVKKDRSLLFHNLAWGGRPLFYLNSRFRENSPLGDEDMLGGSDRERRESAEAIAADYDRYKGLRDLQYVFIDDIREPRPEVWITCYADGTRTVSNGSSLPYECEDHIAVPPFSLRRIAPGQQPKGDSRR